MISQEINPRDLWLFPAGRGEDRQAHELNAKLNSSQSLGAVLPPVKKKSLMTDPAVATPQECDQCNHSFFFIGSMHYVNESKTQQFVKSIVLRV